MPDPHAQARWEQIARRLARQVNLGWWLDHFAPVFLAVSALGVCLVMLARRSGQPLTPVWTALALATAAAAGLTAAVARRRFEPADDARVRLESALGLHNRLTAAASGVGPWPDPPASPARVVAWQWRRPGLALGLGSALLAAAALVPIPPAAGPGGPVAREKPAALAQVEEWVNQLREEPLVQAEALDRLERQAQELMQRPAEQWYEHNSLEAADHLRQRAEQSLRDLQRDLQSAQRALEQFRQFQGAIPAPMVNTWSNQLTGALEGLALGDLPLDASLRQALSALDPARMQSLTPEQAAELAKRLAQSGGKLSALQLGKPGGTPSGQATSCTNGAAVFAGQPGTGGSGTGPGTGSGTTPGEGPGAGGVSRGPGTAPLSFTQNPSEVGSTAQEQLSNPDMRHASPGEITGLTQGQHEVDRNAWQGSAAGGAAGTGQGGETVWMESLTPDERDVLKQYYR